MLSLTPAADQTFPDFDGSGKTAGR